MTATLLAPPESDAAMVVLNISGLRLALPQAEIRALESAPDIDTDETKPFSVGWVQFKQERWPVYCLSQDLSLLVVVPRERRSCIVLDTGAGYIGILCDSVGIREQITPVQHQELPPPMRSPDNPILGLIALSEEEIACASNAERLVEHVTRLVNL
jgi:chemotaxis signal transduction protein